MKLCSVFAAFLLLTMIGTAGAQQPSKKQLDFFEAKIRPVLVDSCYECHSAKAAAVKKLKGGLLLDSREGALQGGESGPAVVPGKPDESLLIAALKHDGFEMPPKGKLPDELIADFVRWIETGAADPRSGEATVAAAVIDIEAGKQHWAFQPLRNVLPPQTTDTNWPQTPVDQFIRARQESAGIQPNAIANAETLIRRVYFDLTGLPPSPEEAGQWLAKLNKENSLDLSAYSDLIDHLLSSDRYGERWARHWLDLARFAESNGYAFDGDRPNAYHYRDFVIQALNADMPYDEFVRLQVAGDLVTNANAETTADAKAAVNALAATGFLVAGPYTTQQTHKERERSRYEQLDDMINTIGTSMLGLTVGCARCHNHKFDPLSQFDYYRLASCFAEVGFADTGVNMQPESYRTAKAEFDAAHAPLVAARTKHEQEQLPARMDQWLASLPDQQVAAPVKLTPWQHAGPFAAANFDEAFDKAFPPESGVDLAQTFVDGTVKWTEQPRWTDGTVHNTLQGDGAANYLFRVIESPEALDLLLSLGSDDALKVWLNGKEVLAKKVSRGAAADQEKVQVALQPGRNELLLKIVNGAGPSGFYFAAMSLVAQELPAIAAWQHIGPFSAADFNVAFDTVFPPETEFDLSKAYDEGKLKWTEQAEWKDGEAHNDKLQGTNCANYLYRVIETKEPRVLNLSLGSDDGIKLWVNGRVVLANKVGRNVAAANQEQVTIQLSAGRNELLMKIVNAGGASGFYFQASSAQPPAEVAAILAVPQEQWIDQQKQKLAEWYRGFDLEWLKLDDAVTRHQAGEPKPDLTQIFSAKVRGSSYSFGEDSFKVYHLRRGNADNKESEAEPGFLQVLMRTDRLEQQWLAPEVPTSLDPINNQQAVQNAAPLAPRVALGNWLTDTDQGAGHLLARVMVNRLWHRHFGRGIVATPSDFGTRGEKPSHPDLLDWLAGELIRHEWKLKPIHKLLMTSAVYMQAGQVAEAGQQTDPENLLFWRRESRRLEAEVIRDSLLSVSGTLDTTMFGKGSLDERSPRRSVYLTVKRSQLIPFLKLFDSPDTMQSVGTREESTVAPQALALLNSAFARDVAAKLAARARPTPETNVSEAIQRAYQIALSRAARDDELKMMTAFIDQQTASRGSAGNAQDLALRDFCQLLLCTNEFVYVD